MDTGDCESSHLSANDNLAFAFLSGKDSKSGSGFQDQVLLTGPGATAGTESGAVAYTVLQRHLPVRAHRGWTRAQRSLKEMLSQNAVPDDSQAARSRDARSVTRQGRDGVLPGWAPAGSAPYPQRAQEKGTEEYDNADEQQPQ
jgi:hypothetical protein